MELILASTSKYRRQQLERLGVPFHWKAPEFDEQAFQHEALRRHVAPRDLAERLAIRKAESVAVSHPDAAVLGGDQLVASGGEILGKPGSAAAAMAQLAKMAGREHELITAIAISHRGETRLHTDVTVLRMRDLSEAEIQRYVAADNPIDCAGSYKIESRGVTLFDEIRSADQSAITGLPLIAVTTMLRELGFEIP